VLYVTLDRHLYGTCKCLEDTFYLVMLVLAFCLDIEIHSGTIGKTLEEVKEHLRGHLAYLLTGELSIPYQPWAASEIKAYLAQAIVHWQGISIALNTSLIA
jgi:hypothetical protein